MNINEAPKFSQTKTTKYSVVSELVEVMKECGVEEDWSQRCQTNWSRLDIKLKETNRSFLIEAVHRCKFTNKRSKAIMTLVKCIDGSVEYQDHDLYFLSSLFYEFSHEGPAEAERHRILLSEEDGDTIRNVKWAWRELVKLELG